MQKLASRHNLLRIFSKVHCFNKEQLPHYVDGCLPHVEQHLLEQHLVNCELCCNAVHVLQQPNFATQYQITGLSIQQHIRNNSFLEPKTDESEREERKAQIEESFLLYFWSTVAIVIAVTCVYMVL
jgi:predicted anti-sigma-YlaC factor YlaD